MTSPAPSFRVLLLGSAQAASDYAAKKRLATDEWRHATRVDQVLGYSNQTAKAVLLHDWRKTCAPGICAALSRSGVRMVNAPGTQRRADYTPHRKPCTPKPKPRY